MEYYDGVSVYYRSFFCYPSRPNEYYDGMDWKNADAGEFAYIVLHLLPLPLGKWTNQQSCKIPYGETNYVIKQYNFWTADAYDKVTVVINIFLIFMIIYGIFRGIRWIFRVFRAGLRSYKK